ncbi:MAG: SGNH/GDSL hydrolase family protein [Clostridia bacterium]|nr:SGNH/GDSL hydrolase family protein [Clostridia bacterium]
MKILEKLRCKTQVPALAAPVKIAFLGDSVTHGCFEVMDRGERGADCLYDQTAVYHARLKRKMDTAFPNRPVSIINAGISGDTAPGGAKRVARDVIAVDPDLTVVCFGLNDVLQPAGVDGYVAGLRSIFEQLQAAHIDIIFMTPNMMCNYVCDSDSAWFKEYAPRCTEAQNSGLMDAFMQAARDLCAEMGVTLCDCYKDWKRLESLGADIPFLLSNRVNHPTREMHALFADRLFNTIILSDN